MKATTLTVEKSRELDRRAQEEYGFPSLILMENAGIQLAKVIQRSLIPPMDLCRIIFVCGGGNNAGDAFVAARHLKQWDINNIEIFLTGSDNKLTKDANINFRIIREMGLPLYSFADFASAQLQWARRPLLMIDAVMGNGFTPPLRDEAKNVIQKMNEFKKHHNSSIRVIAVDIPSGLCGDKGPGPP